MNEKNAFSSSIAFVSGRIFSISESAQKKFAGDGEGGHVTEWQERQIWNSDCLSSQVLKI